MEVCAFFFCRRDIHNAQGGEKGVFYLCVCVEAIMKYG
jgi:hypothetical protein